MKAFVFPGQGAQKPGMGLDLFRSSELAREKFLLADRLLGFEITKIMFEGTEEDLKQTDITQPAVFLHSVIMALCTGEKPDMVAGHSLGEFSALVINGALSFENALILVSKRAKAMQKACMQKPSAMAAVVGLDDSRIEEICAQVDGIVVPANYNCPGQLVISGENEAVSKACALLKQAGAKRALPLPVGGAFHSPLMEPARVELAEAISETEFSKPICPVYQNCDAKPYTDPEKIKANLIAQLTSPVKWTQSVRNMIEDGADSFVEFGPGKTLVGLIKRIDGTVSLQSGSELAIFS